jgi:fructoselysine-6-P-deglycase FrlB-like protein
MLTLQEIKEQYCSMQKTEEYLFEKVEQVQILLNERPNRTIVFLGSGSSYSIGAACAQNTITGLGRLAVALTAGDVLINGERYKALFENAIIVAITRSGETSEILRALDALTKMYKVQVISLICTEGSPLSKISDVALEMPWAFDNSVCQTRAVSCLYFSWISMIAQMTDNQTQKADLQKVISGGDAYIKRIEEPIKELAKLPWDHVVVLGDAEIAGVCEEGALAFKEICQLPSNFYHVLDVRHGPMVLIGEKTLVIMPLSDYSPELQRSLLEDIKEKGATVIVYTNQATELNGAINLYFGEELCYPVMGLPVIVIAQLISYYKSLITGTDPDNPTGLAAWIELK